MERDAEPDSAPLHRTIRSDRARSSPLVSPGHARADTRRPAATRGVRRDSRPSFRVSALLYRLVRLGVVEEVAHAGLSAKDRRAGQSKEVRRVPALRAGADTSPWVRRAGGPSPLCIVPTARQSATHSSGYRRARATLTFGSRQGRLKSRYARPVVAHAVTDTMTRCGTPQHETVPTNDRPSESEIAFNRASCPSNCPGRPDSSSPQPYAPISPAKGSALSFRTDDPAATFGRPLIVG